MRLERFRVVSVVLALALGAAACGDDAGDAGVADPTSASEPAELSDEPTSSEPADDDVATSGEPADDEPVQDADPTFPRTVTDAFGDIEINEAPQRVVVLDQSLLDAALTLELEVIGYTTFMDPDGPIPDLYGAAAAEFATDAQWVGDLFAPSLESIAALQPDAILTAAVRHEGIRAQLSAIAPTIMSESAGFGWKDTIRLVAEATGREEMAAAALDAYEARAAAIGAAINDAFDNPTISVLRLVDPPRLYQPVSFSGVVLTDAGLDRPESQRSQEEFSVDVSVEELGLADADFMFWATIRSPEADVLLDELFASPLWNTIPVVQRGDVLEVEDQRWMSGVGLFGAHAILDDLAETFSVDDSTAN
ncbi:MAG: iron-siderophore ABC transporter substrate-binding protein [Actinomycetota bacterium]